MNDNTTKTKLPPFFSLLSKPFLSLCGNGYIPLTVALTFTSSGALLQDMGVNTVTLKREDIPHVLTDIARFRYVVHYTHDTVVVYQLDAEMKRRLADYIHD